MSASAGSAWTLSLADLTQATGGKILSHPNMNFSKVGTDTRQDLTGRLFVALKGDRYDAHDYLGQAIAAGATVVLVHQWREEWKPLLAKTSFVQVGDTLQALQALALFWRRKNKFVVLGITGSNGKTSTKEFTYAVLKDSLSVHASKGSFNNHWGVPLTILEASPSHTHLVLEMGMNHLGEIWRLCQIAEPNVVVVTMVGRAHIGELGSQENVAKAKEEIYLGATKAVQVFNLDNEWTIRMQSRSKSKQVTFSSFKSSANVYLRAQRMTWEGLDLIGTIGGVQGRTWVHVLGRQNTVNLMAAASLGLAVGLKPDAIWKALGTIRDVAWGRNQVVKLTTGSHVLFDAYNANPDSMGALIKNLYEMDTTGRKFLVVGDMLELGEFSDKMHEELGERAGNVGFAGIWFVGKSSAAFRRGLERATAPEWLKFSEAVDPAIAKNLLEQLKPEDLVAVKASRGVGLEKVLEGWPLAAPLGTKP
jgi:UDP-N-acetylmuramoyl-tripeptide--D-alanyl-D-alanine ligase